MRITILALVLITAVGCTGLTARTPILEDGIVVGHETSILDEILSAGTAQATKVGLAGDAAQGDWLGVLTGAVSVLVAGGGAGVVAHRRKKAKEATRAA